jgi:flagellar hook-length control protein FliK
MLENRLGVSPPQVGKTQDSKVTNVKDFQENAESKSAYKADFENALKEKLQKQRSDLEKKKELERRELRAEQKAKKSSGGTKKKMTDVDDKMVSNSMASKENVVETPDSKKTELATIKVNTEKSSEIKEVSDLAQSIEAQQAQEMKLLESELAAASGFEPNAEAVGSQQDLMNKIKQFEPEQKLNESATQAFEKNVLEQLQKDSSFNSSQFAQSDSNQDSGLEQKDKSDLKSDILSNELHQAAGQTHSSFKSHIQAASETNLAAQMTDKLESNREANMNEIMSKAQYLVQKGGGEVTVKMSPEGMGEVSLKVQLLDGKLNVEMQTQDKHIKKLIEDSLSDLKSGLAAHRLSLEHVKIDTVNATNTDNSAQMQSNQQQGGSEQGAREFWQDMQGQMNQQSSQKNYSQSFADSSRASSVVSTPRATQAQAARTYGGTKGATINRVA